MDLTDDIILVDTPQQSQEAVPAQAEGSWIWKYTEKVEKYDDRLKATTLKVVCKVATNGRPCGKMYSYDNSGSHRGLKAHLTTTHGLSAKGPTRDQTIMTRFINNGVLGTEVSTFGYIRM